jgi:hypothetical protein
MLRVARGRRLFDAVDVVLRDSATVEHLGRDCLGREYDIAVARLPKGNRCTCFLNGRYVRCVCFF